ncbi:hypothetical protein NXS19_010626 [Fusarium pseudograminearum]|nr:hypothetical protein NXS19_010626 [Fusarium pseudograminearum]
MTFGDHHDAVFHGSSQLRPPLYCSPILSAYRLPPFTRHIRATPTSNISQHEHFLLSLERTDREISILMGPIPFSFLQSYQPFRAHNAKIALILLQDDLLLLGHTFPHKGTFAPSQKSSTGITTFVPLPNGLSLSSSGQWPPVGDNCPLYRGKNET